MIAFIAIFSSIVVAVSAFTPRNSVLKTTGTACTNLRMAAEKAPLTGRALIVQNKGGGHGTVGYNLCKELIAANPSLDVTILQDACDYSKPPFSSYDELKALGANIVETKIAESVPDLSGSFDYIVDNWSKDATNAAVAIDIAKASNSKQLLFVSSAGMYKPADASPHVETDAVKDNGARQVEVAIMESGVPYTFMRPQYIYGPKISKRYLDFFMGRANRKLPIPLPLSGEQLVCLTHIEDVATLLSAAVGHPAATNEIFNCGTDRYVSYQGICTLIHDVLKTPEEDRKYMYYDPKDFSHWKGSGAQVFPFRRDTFITTPSKAKLALGWSPAHVFSDDVAAEVADYLGTADPAKEWATEELKYDLEVLASKDPGFMFTYPFFDDASINPESRPYPFESA